MDGNGALFGTLSGNTRDVVHKFSVDLPKKHGRGGQSGRSFRALFTCHKTLHERNTHSESYYSAPFRPLTRGEKTQLRPQGSRGRSYRTFMFPSRLLQGPQAVSHAQLLLGNGNADSEIPYSLQCKTISRTIRSTLLGLSLPGLPTSRMI